MSNNCIIAPASRILNPTMPGYLLYLDFADYDLGSQIIVDQSPSKVSLPRVGTNLSNFGVVDVPGVGRCFQFNGGTYFYSNIPLNFSTDDYDLEIGFIKPNTALQVLFATGDWNSSNTRGFAVSMDQYPSTAFEQFVNTGTGSYQRNLFNGANTQAFTEFLIQKRSTGYTITNKTTGAKQTFGAFSTGGDTFLAVGGSSNNAGLFAGYLKYLRLKKP